MESVVGAASGKWSDRLLFFDLLLRLQQQTRTLPRFSIAILFPRLHVIIQERKGAAPSFFLVCCRDRLLWPPFARGEPTFFSAIENLDRYSIGACRT